MISPSSLNRGWPTSKRWVPKEQEIPPLTHAFTELRYAREGFLVAGATHPSKLGWATRELLPRS